MPDDGARIAVLVEPARDESTQLRELVAHLRQSRTQLREEWARRITEARLLTAAMTPEEIFAEATAVYDNYLEALETGAIEALEAYARNLSERIIPRGVETHEVVRQLNERLEEEVRRIAHAIHDEGGQLLGSLHLALEEFARGLPRGANARLAPVRKLLFEIEQQLRHLSHELRPTILDDLGLLPALEFLADRVSKRSGLVITVQGELGDPLPPATATGLYRSVQEALTNVMRHAQATHVHVEVLQDDGVIKCTTRDDGVGFDVPAVLSRRGDRGLGLIGIRERVAALGGTLTIRSAPGQGTELLITIPVRS